MYDYVPSKEDWFARGMPRDGEAAGVPWSGDFVRDAPTCTPDELVGEVAERASKSDDDDFCVVIHGKENVVVGLLRGDALLKSLDARVEDVMELGPQTTLPNEPLDELLRSNDAVGVKHFFVATSRGTFLGILDRDEAERAVAEWTESRGSEQNPR